MRRSAVLERGEAEASRAAGGEWVIMNYLDIEKAYPRICKDGLWKLLGKRGCPQSMLGVLKALHENTAYRVKYQGKMSKEW